jgi:Arc/MetJ-type ribon-helix-helix transcriptional regulator
MTIEIHQPELERRVREGIESGRFHDVDELLTKALDALHEKETAPAGQLTQPKRPRPEGKKSLVELFAESPLKGLDLDFSRSKSIGRPVDL